MLCFEHTNQAANWLGHHLGWERQSQPPNLYMHGISLEQQLKELKERGRKLSGRDRWHNKARTRTVYSNMHREWLIKNHKELLSCQTVLGTTGVVLFTSVVSIILSILFASGIPSLTIMSGGPVLGLTVLGILIFLNRR